MDELTGAAVGEATGMQVDHQVSTMPVAEMDIGEEPSMAQAASAGASVEHASQPSKLAANGDGCGSSNPLLQH